jgi:hypothetical protein
MKKSDRDKLLKEQESRDRALKDLTPSLPVLITLGSIAVHAEELLSPDGHPFDQKAIESLLSQPELKAWISRMDGMAFLPKKRNQRT